MSEDKAKTVQAELAASLLSEDRREGHTPPDEEALPGVAPIRDRRRSPVEIELALLRQAYQEHGKLLGRMMTMLVNLETKQDELAAKIDRIAGVCPRLDGG